MNTTRITYRNSASPYNQYAVVPVIFYYDLILWLVSDLSEIVSVEQGLSDDPLLPESWPSYQTCVEHMRISDLVTMTL